MDKSRNIWISHNYYVNELNGHGNIKVGKIFLYALNGPEKPDERKPMGERNNLIVNGILPPPKINTRMKEVNSYK
jgi:hypothetical protein